MTSGRSTWKKALAGVAFAVVLMVPGMTIAQEATLTPYEPAVELGELEGQIVIDGSSTVGPIAEALAEEFMLAGAEKVQTTVDISGTGGGFKRFCAGETDLQNASRPIKDAEREVCAEAGVEYYELEIAYDGLAIIVNPENDFVSCLTVDQLAAMWAPDSAVKTWADVDPSWPAEEIAFYGAGSDSGTFDYFTETINGEAGATRTDYTPSEDDNVLVEGVAGDENAIGYFGLAYYEANADRLKLVEVDGGNGCVAPMTDSVQDGSYAPLSRPLYLYVNAASLARPEVQEFVRFAIATAPELVGEVGYVASPVETYVEDQVKIEGAIAGSVAPDGPVVEATPAA